MLGLIIAVSSVAIVFAINSLRDTIIDCHNARLKVDAEMNNKRIEADTAMVDALTKAIEKKRLTS